MSSDTVGSGPAKRSRRALQAAILLAVSGTGLFAAGAAENARSAENAEPYLVVYGPEASDAEGDPDHRQTLYISLPADTAVTHFLRLYDANVGGKLESENAEGTTRFAIYGGPGAFRGPLRPAQKASAEGGITGGRLLKEADFGTGDSVRVAQEQESIADSRWITFAELHPADADRFADKLYFRLDVEGRAGASANLFDVLVSTSETGSEMARNAAIFAYEVTFRASSETRPYELRYQVPPTAKLIDIQNFDAAGGLVAIDTPFRRVEQIGSENNAWRSAEILLDRHEAGRPGAVAFLGGREAPNDLSFAVLVEHQDGRRHPLAINLPIHLVPDNLPPSAEAEITRVGCLDFSFDASLSEDPEGADLTYHWMFPDGSKAEGVRVAHRFPSPGTYLVRLEISDGAARIANGAALDLEVRVPEPPVARIAALPQVLAVGEPFRFDASPSSVGGGASLSSYSWQFDDEVAEGITAQKGFKAPGVHEVMLTVGSEPDAVCSTAQTTASVTVNAPPTAEAGENLVVAVGEHFVLDGTGSHDRDGRLISYRWNTGEKEEVWIPGRTLTHAYAHPGTYTVTLSVEDSSGAANSFAEDSLVVTVEPYRDYHPPRADAGADRSVPVGETFILDGSASQAGSSLVAYEWDFGDGTSATGKTVRHAYWRPGTYEVALTVRDGSGATAGSATDDLTVTAMARRNKAPVAEISGPKTARPGERLLFDGFGSRDPDGHLVGYEWSLGDIARSNGETALFAFDAPGTYPVRLRVVDNSGAENGSGEAEIMVTVEE